MRCLRPQKMAFPELIVPAWLEPLPDESIDEYAQRMVSKIGTIDAKHVDRGRIVRWHYGTAYGRAYSAQGSYSARQRAPA